MDADALIIELNGLPEPLAEVTVRTVSAMRGAGKLPGMSGDLPRGANYDTAAEVDAIVAEVVKDFARLEYRLDANAPPEALTARLWSTMLGHIDWRKVGAYYYDHAREAYADANGLEAYPS
jgi:hypothetical protein